MSANPNYLINVREARNLLGSSYDVYSDEYIRELINKLDAIAEAFIKTIPKD